MTRQPQADPAKSARTAAPTSARPVTRPLAATADSAAQLMRWHAAAGNQAVQYLMRLSRLQAKLTVSSPGDAYELEAERVADEVMRMAEPAVGVQQHAPSPRVSRACPACQEEVVRRPIGEEDEIQAQSATPGRPLQRAASGEDGTLHSEAHASDYSAPSQAVEDAIHSLAGRGSPLPESVRTFMEPRLGHDFSEVRIHTDPPAHELARAVNAQAFTVGRDVVFGSGYYAPETEHGKHLLAHELTHVIQQNGDLASVGRKVIGDEVDVSMDAASAQHLPRVMLPAPPMVARGEKWDAFWDVGPLDAMKAKELADKALNAAQQTGLPGLHNGPADAWRHCYWNCLMTDEIGRDQAKSIADNHEKHGGGPAIENLMDSRNNWEGRECGGSNCDSCCQTKLDTGVLDVIEGGKMVPSKKTPRKGGKQSDKYEY